MNQPLLIDVQEGTLGDEGDTVGNNIDNYVPEDEQNDEEERDNQERVNQPEETNENVRRNLRVTIQDYGAGIPLPH